MPDRPRKTDVLVIGGGPAGLAAAASAAEAGARVLLVDRNRKLGGILNQCIHDGFGLHTFGEVLTGPEFAAHYVNKVLEAGVEVYTDTLVAGISAGGDVILTSFGSRWGIRAGAVVLAMGCRERTRGMIRIPGTRPAGVYTAGTAQWLTNMANIRVGNRIVILGSGDIGLIMARRLRWEGADVVAVIELLPYPSGLPRNITQCLDDYDIPLYLSHSVTEIHGRDRLEGVTVARYDDSRRPIPGTEFRIECDTLLLSVGLIPENELSRRGGVDIDRVTLGPRVDDRYVTSVDGVFACGNVLHIHDIADWAADEGTRAGRTAADYALGRVDRHRERIPVEAREGIRYVVPQSVDRTAGDALLSFRVREPGEDKVVTVKAGGDAIASERFRRVHPATMIQLSVPLKLPRDVDRLEVSLS